MAYGLLIKTLLAFEFIIYIIVYVQKPQFLLRYCFNSITSITLIILLYPLFLCCSKKGLNIINNELRLRRLTNLNNLKMLWSPWMDTPKIQVWSCKSSTKEIKYSRKSLLSSNWSQCYDREIRNLNHILFSPEVCPGFFSFGVDSIFRENRNIFDFLSFPLLKKILRLGELHTIKRRAYMPPLFYSSGAYAPCLVMSLFLSVHNTDRDNLCFSVFWASENSLRLLKNPKNLDPKKAVTVYFQLIHNFAWNKC